MSDSIQDVIITVLVEILNILIRIIFLSLYLAISYFIAYWMQNFRIFYSRSDSSTKVKKLKAALNIKNLNLNKFESNLAEHILLPEELSVTWKDVAGLDDVIKKLKRNVIYPMLADKKVKSESVSCPKGVLLHGPPGCGKTLLAKAIAKEVKCRFLNIDVSSIFDKWLGESEKYAKAIFTLAEKVQPCIVFVDEIDSLMGARCSRDHEVTARMKTQFMSLWDGVITDQTKTIIILGATNRPAAVDKAILRRMTTKINIPLPNTDHRKNVLDLLLKKEKLDDGVEIEVLAKLTEGLSCSDLKDVVRDTGVNCLEDGTIITPQILDFIIKSEDEKCHPKDILTHQMDDASTAYWMKRRLPLIKKLQNDKEKGHLSALYSRPYSMHDLTSAIQQVKESKSLCENNWV